MSKRKVVRLNESQLRTLVRMMKESVGMEEGTVAEVPANNFFHGDDAIAALEAAGFNVSEEYKTPDAPRPRYRTGEEMEGEWHRRPVFVITHQDGGMFRKAEVEDALRGIDIAGQLRVTFTR